MYYNHIYYYLHQKHFMTINQLSQYSTAVADNYYFPYFQMNTN